MLIALAMWIATIVLGIADFKTRSTRWAMGLTFFAGVAGFSIFWSDNLVSMVMLFGLTNETYKIIEAIFSALSHYLIPYCALMFGLSYSMVLPKYQKLFSVLLLIPMIITFLFFPTHDYGFTTSSQSIKYYRFVSIWAVPYSLLSCILQIYAYFKENIPNRKRERFIFCLIAVPGITFTTVTTYLLAGLPVDQPWKYWRYNDLIILYMFVVFLYCLIKFDVLGIKLRIEKQNLSNMMNVLNSGMNILNHSLKNEITKISICITNIKLSLHDSGKDESEINENLHMVSTSLEYLTTMMKKLQKSAINPEIIELSQNNLADIIENALKCVAVFLKVKNIRVYKNVNYDIFVLCDKEYLQEVFVNLCQNSIEALKFEGKLTIETNLTDKGLFIVVKDSGTGISEKDLPHVIEPFFTTKDKRQNFGLGLSYCYNVLKKHEASIEVQSTINIGTTINIFFPKNKVVLESN
jgi:two-component system sporulation sensor kinase B